jgi:hypothetical protein
MFKGVGCGMLFFFWIAGSMLFSILNGAMTWTWFIIDSIFLYLAISWMMGGGNSGEGGIPA